MVCAEPLTLPHLGPNYKNKCYFVGHLNLKGSLLFGRGNVSITVYLPVFVKVYG